MSLHLSPEPHAEGWRWTIGDVVVVVDPVRHGWRYARTGLQAPGDLEGEHAAAPPIEVSLRLGEGPLVAYLDPPVLLLPGENRVLWIAWPLEVMAARGALITDSFRPGLRHTLIGPVDVGEVMEAVVCPVLERRDCDEVHLTTGHAALRVRASNRAAQPVNLRRFPMAPAELALYRRADLLMAGDVSVVVSENRRAEARSSVGAPPEGYAMVEAHPTDSRRSGGLSLDWLLEATRKSSEFSL